MAASVVYDLISSASAEGVEEFVTLFAYEGFNPEMVHGHFARIQANKGIGPAELISDVRAIITLGAMKGNFTVRNAGKISVEGRAKAEALYAKYELKQGSLGNDKKAIILPRVLSAFPELTTKVVLKAPSRDFGTRTGVLPKFIKNPVFPSLIPKSLPDNVIQTLLYIYNVYSADQSLAISKTSDFNDAFTNQRQFILIAFNSPIPSELVRKRMMKAQMNEVSQAVNNMSAVDVGVVPSTRANQSQTEVAIEALIVN